MCKIEPVAYVLECRAVKKVMVLPDAECVRFDAGVVSPRNRQEHVTRTNSLE